MSFMNVYKKYLTTVALVWAAYFIVLVFVYMLILGPMLADKKRVEDKLAATKLKYETLVRESQEDARTKLREEIELLRSRMEDFTIDFENSANLTFDISRIAGAEQIASFSIRSRDDSRRTSDLTEGKYVSESQIDVSFNAGFHQFATFLNALERHRPVLLVDRFTVNGLRQSASGPQVDMNLVVLVRKQQDS